MKNKKFNQIAGAFLMFALLVSMSSCSKKDQLPGQPTLNSISAIKNLTVPITGGNMGDWIAISGENLENVSKIQFNDVDVNLLDVYYEKKILYLQVPIAMPTAITDKVKITTTSGSVEYNYKVAIPNLKLTGMFNEYTAPGDTLKIYGSFFKLYKVDKTNTVVSFGGAENPVIDAGDNYLTVKVPQNAASNVKLKVVNKAFNVTADCPGYYQDRQFMITNFDDVPYTGGDGASFVGAWTNPKPVSGKYTYLKVGNGGSGWSYLMSTGASYTADMKDNPNKYVVKFELNMITPIMKTKFYIYNYWNYNPAEITAADLVVQNLGVWQTISIPLERIIPMNFTGNKAYIGSFNIRIESPAGEPVNMCWDNFRVSKKD